MMYPNAPDFQEKLEYLQPKLLSRYRDLFKHVKDGELKCLESDNNYSTGDLLPF